MDEKETKEEQEADETCIYHTHNVGFIIRLEETREKNFIFPSTWKGSNRTWKEREINGAKA